MQGGQKRKSPQNYKKYRLKLYKSLPIRLDVFVKLKYQSNTKILSGGIKYSVHGYFLRQLCLTRKLAMCVTYKLNDDDVSALSGISSLKQAENFIVNELPDGDLWIFDFHIFSLF